MTIKIESESQKPKGFSSNVLPPTPLLLRRPKHATRISHCVVRHGEIAKWISQAQDKKTKIET